MAERCGQFNESWRSRCVACGASLRHFGGWFSLREPRGSEVERWPADANWRELQRVHFEGSQPATEVVRPAHVAGQRSTLMRMGAGVLRSMAATDGALRRLVGRYEQHRGCVAKCSPRCTVGEQLRALRLFDEGVRVLKEQAIREGLFNEEGDRKGRTYVRKFLGVEKRRRKLEESERAMVDRIVPLHQRPSHEPRSVSAIRNGWRPSEELESSNLRCTCGHPLDVHRGKENGCTSEGCTCVTFIEEGNHGDQRRAEAERRKAEGAGAVQWAAQAQARSTTRKAEQTGFTFGADGRLQWPQRAPGDDGGDDEPA